MKHQKLLDTQVDTISIELERSFAREKIHLLGTVQPHGFVMVVDSVDECIVQVSSGIARHWPGLDRVGNLTGMALSAWVEVIPAAASNGASALSALLSTVSVAYPMVLPLRPRFERTCGDTAPDAAVNWECFGHRSGANVVLEWQPGPEEPASAHRNGRLFADITQAIARLRHADGLEMFFNECVQVMQGFCSFDRVMIYRFLPDDCGEVVAECAANGHQERFRGLRFPASDIPGQARRLYLNNRLCVQADVEAEPDTLVPALLPQGGSLDQSHCVLRGLLPGHLSYLRNMRVRATLTLSIVHGEHLWGLIVCHHHQPRVPPHHVRESLRQICELIGEVATMRIEALTQLAAVQHRLTLDHQLNQLHQALMMGGEIAAVLALRLPDLLKAFGATGFGLRIGQINYLDGPTSLAGSTHQALDEVGARADASSRSPTVLMWDDLLSEARLPLRRLPQAAGMLLAQRRDDEPAFCFLTRAEVVQQVRWSGEIGTELMQLPDGRIRPEPRRSFIEWQQAVKGKSTAWQQVEADALTTLLRSLCEVHKLQVNRALREKLHWRAQHDQLTGLYNRRAMEDEVSKLLADGQFNVVLLLLDLDHLKKINDTCSHATGDQVLQQLSQRLGGVIREFDLLARLGGDEFMLLLQIARPDAPRALAFAERLHEAVAMPFYVDGLQLRVSISVGIAIPPQHGRTVGELLRRADQALFHAKALGRSRSVVFEATMESDQLAFYLLERDLLEAIEQKQLSLVYQPKVDLLRQRVVGLEALVRWNHPTRGLSLPAVFIPIAERSDQIVQIDRWVMREAIAVQAQWRAQGLPTLPIAINLSMADILSSNLLAFVSDLLAHYKVSADALEVEVTESCMMRELELTQSVLLALNRHGIATTLDDFGTGFSSLSYLRQLPLQCLKIDQSFTQSMLQDANTEKLTQAILAMGVALDMRIVAEGVETVEQMRWLLQHGCHIGQGYYFSPPVAADKVHETIRGIELRLAQQAS